MSSHAIALQMSLPLSLPSCLPRSLPRLPPFLTHSLPPFLPSSLPRSVWNQSPRFPLSFPTPTSSTLPTSLFPLLSALSPPWPLSAFLLPCVVWCGLGPRTLPIHSYCSGLHASTMRFFHDTVSEWLRRWTKNPLGSARRGSNPLGVVLYIAAPILKVAYDNALCCIHRSVHALTPSAVDMIASIEPAPDP